MEKVGLVSLHGFASGSIKAESILSRSDEIGSVLQEDNNQVGDVMSGPLV